MAYTDRGAPAATAVPEAPVLFGVHGRLAIQVAGKRIGTLVVEDGHLELIQDDGPAEATMKCATADEAVNFIRGRVNPVVATLRGWIRFEGDRSFGAQVAMGLRAGVPIGGISVDRLIGTGSTRSGKGGK